MAEWSCRCGAKNEPTWRYCEGCGGENPKAVKSAAPSVPETHRPWQPPAYSGVATPEQAKAAIAEIKAILAKSMTLEDKPERRRRA